MNLPWGDLSRRSCCRRSMPSRPITIITSTAPSMQSSRYCTSLSYHHHNIIHMHCEILYQLLSEQVNCQLERFNHWPDPQNQISYVLFNSRWNKNSTYKKKFQMEFYFVRTIREWNDKGNDLFCTIKLIIMIHCPLMNDQVPRKGFWRSSYTLRWMDSSGRPTTTTTTTSPRSGPDIGETADWLTNQHLLHRPAHEVTCVN